MRHNLIRSVLFHVLDKKRLKADCREFANKIIVATVFYAEAEVLFEYEPTQEDELALKVGVILQNVKEVRVVCVPLSPSLPLAPRRS